MITYRITKYNPQHRDAEGNYLLNDEWTSVYDIQNPRYTISEIKDYLLVETAYIDTIAYLLDHCSITSLKIKDLENRLTDKEILDSQQELGLESLELPSDLKEGKNCTIEEVKLLSTLTLRELVWMSFEAEQFQLSFGYDYYMYVTCQELKKEQMAAIERGGLFVENMDKLTTN